MAVKLSDTVRNAKLDAVETAIGVSPTLKLRSGAAPANCAAGDSGTVVATLLLPSDWMAAASGGVKAKSGTWQDLSADNGATIAHYRIYDSGGTCHLQGTVTITGGGGDMEVDNPVVNAGQVVQVTSYQWTEGNG